MHNALMKSHYCVAHESLILYSVGKSKFSKPPSFAISRIKTHSVQRKGNKKWELYYSKINIVITLNNSNMIKYYNKYNI